MYICYYFLSYSVSRNKTREGKEAQTNRADERQLPFNEGGRGIEDAEAETEAGGQGDEGWRRQCSDVNSLSG